ncbi:MAG TPA: inositol monophosphatase family protein [Solirubrobacteraceae bacterium]
MSGSGELLALAEAVAREAGALLLEYAAGERRGVTSKSTATDLVSEADLATERLIRERLIAVRPDDAIVGEEGDDRPGRSGLRWVVDPLDGTVNFLFRIPQWCVSVAVEDAAGGVAGVVFDPSRGELWAAARDGAPTCDGEPIAASSREDLGTAMVATGFGYDAEVRRRQAATVARLLPQVRDIRRLGSAALDLVWTAAGRYDAYFERGVQPWDVAAGRLICERAGLAVRDLPPDPPQGQGILVAPPALIEPLHALVA